MSRFAFPPDLIAGTGNKFLSMYCRKSKDEKHEKAFNTEIKETFNFSKCYFIAIDFQIFNF